MDRLYRLPLVAHVESSSGSPANLCSVVIAAHNEAATVGACLDALLPAGADPVPEVVVVANGCADETAEAAKRPGVKVITLPEPGKARALNIGEAAASVFPRLFLDADVVLPDGALAALVAGLRSPGVLAVTPARYVDVTGRPWPVRAYQAVNARLPAFDDALYGRGTIMLSEEGRRRFERFPDVLADDLFLDSCFVASEKRQIDEVTVRLEAPRTTSALVRRLVRVRRGNSALRETAVTDGPQRVRSSRRWSWLRDVAIPNPRLIPHAVVYAAITAIAAVTARVRPGSRSWGQDATTRGGR